MSSVVEDGAWLSPTGRRYTGEVVHLAFAAPPLVPLSDQLDSSVWTVDPKGSYSAKCALKQCAISGPHVPLFKFIWGQRNVLQHAFVVRLSTKDRQLNFFKACFHVSLFSCCLELCPRKCMNCKKA